MKTINLTPSIRAALLQSVEQSIDILNDMLLDPMFLSPTQVRELATMPDEEIRNKFQKNAAMVDKDVQQLINLQILYSELKTE